MNLANIKLAQINVGERFRKEVGDIAELADSIKEVGLINPIAIYSETGDPPFKLAAGGRRFAAYLYLKRDEIPCRIYDHPLSELELRSIELEENIRRKELTYTEEVYLKREIVRLQQEIHGVKVSTAPDAPGVSIRDVAKLIGKDSGELSKDIKLANTMEAFPEVGWENCKNRNEAMKLMNRMEETMVRQEISKRAEKALGKSTTKKLIDAYAVTDAFDQATRIPDRTFNLVEIDPPYAIDLPQLKLHSGGGDSGGNKFKINYGESYNEIDASQYEFFMAGLLKEAYRVMTDDGWLILWFGPEPWFEKIFNLVSDAGFKTRRLCGIWVKPTGQTNHPDMYLASSYEMFFYAQKGGAVINLDKRGRSNIFQFNPVPPLQKTHPTERPIALMEELLETFAHEGERIWVPLCGSGNTLIAANNLRMYPLGCDLSQEYRDAYTVKILTREEGDALP